MELSNERFCSVDTQHSSNRSKPRPSNVDQFDDSMRTLELAIISLEGASNPQKFKERWNSVDLGLFQTIFIKWFKNVSQKTSVVLAVLSNIVFSLFDTMSDFAVVYTLCTQNEWKYGIIVMIVDYIPGWQLVVHNLFSEKWSKLRNTKANVINLIFLMVSPFSVPLFFTHWLLSFTKANRKTFDYLHHNSRLSQLLAGSLESPLQLMLLFVLYGDCLLYTSDAADE